jgi:hypothetical protein
VIVRMNSHQPTKNYIARRTAEGLTKQEIIRCLKRYVARELFPTSKRSSHPPSSSHPSTPGALLDIKRRFTYVLVVLDTRNAGYGAPNIVPKAAVMCGCAVKLEMWERVSHSSAEVLPLACRRSPCGSRSRRRAPFTS